MAYSLLTSMSLAFWLTTRTGSVKSVPPPAKAAWPALPARCTSCCTFSGARLTVGHVARRRGVRVLAAVGGHVLGPGRAVEVAHLVAAEGICVPTGGGVRHDAEHTGSLPTPPRGALPSMLMTDWGALYRDHVDAVERPRERPRRRAAEDRRARHAGLDRARRASPPRRRSGRRGRRPHGRRPGARVDRAPRRRARRAAGRRPGRRAGRQRRLRRRLGRRQPAARQSSGTWPCTTPTSTRRSALRLLPERLWLPVAEAVGADDGARAGRRSAPPYEVFRSVFSRRSRAQMAAWGAEVDAERLDAMCIFGPRDDDQPIPA